MGAIGAGVIGCGNISQAYFDAIKQLPDLDILACADINMDAARAKAAANGVDALTVDELLGRDDIEVVINLTLPQTHAEVNRQILNAGKHAHCEKPFAVTREDGLEVLELAKSKGLRVGCAPDTFLGGGHQTVRKLIDDGAIGRPVSGTAFFATPGHERWHPNPGFYYLTGGGPVFDMGPYYITALVNLLGPVVEVTSMNSRKADARIATSEAANGKVLPVEVDTHSTALLRFENGAVITMVLSFDIWKHTNHNIEIHGTDGSISVPDPNFFGGDVKLSEKGEDWKVVPHTHPFEGNMRGLGPTDLAAATRTGRPHRCSGELAYHVLDVMHAIDEATARKSYVQVKSRCERPAPMRNDLKDGYLD
ncbi:MAG: Gfo/Idh/MocA family oxidoreductase [Hyphomicrobiaceae bacterium]|nr:Gfo/Idh/MocA family oxidoreductase [Hyphomicrobiaceae bacterium]MCC0025228.1 Gfo/Idh/MocA family oxidoreductase [Hyphomicrobiaceae bacterium]